MAGNEEENLNIQFPVDEDVNVANYPTQATFHADPRYINVDGTAPRNVRELQEAAFHVIQTHAEDRGRIEELSILISRRLNGQPITENNFPHWTAALEEFVQKLRAFTNQEVQTGPIKEQLEKGLGVPLDKILKYCIKCFFTLKGYKEKQKFCQGLFQEHYIKRLKDAYISEEFRDRVTTIRSDVVKEDGTTLTEEERATVSQFLQKILSEVTITIWFELDQLLPLLEEHQESMELSRITITIDLTGEPRDTQPPTLDAVKETLSKAISYGNETIRKEFAYLIDPMSSDSGVEASADIQVPTGDLQVISEGHHPVTSERIIRLVVRKLLDKYEEVVGSSELATKRKIQREMTAKSQTEPSSITSTEVISKMQEHILKPEEQILKMEEQMIKLKEQMLKEKEQRIKAEEHTRKLEDVVSLEKKPLTAQLNTTMKRSVAAAAAGAAAAGVTAVAVTAASITGGVAVSAAVGVAVGAFALMKLLPPRKSNIAHTIKNPAVPHNTETSDDAVDSEHAHSE